MRTSSAGLAFLSGEEGCVLHPYNDSQRNATIGVGHLIHLGPVTAADNRRYAHFTRSDAIALLRSDVAKVEATIRAHVHVGLNQHQFDALVSLGFNIGTGGLARSTVVRRLNAHDYRGAANAILMWDIPSELRGRRLRERALFLTPVHHHRDPRLKYLTAHEYEIVHQYRMHRDASHRQAVIDARKRVYRAAAHSGWNRLHRRDRWHELDREAAVR